MPRPVTPHVAIVPDGGSGLKRNSLPQSSAKGDTVPREKRIAQEVAYQIAPQIRRALAGQDAEPLVLAFERKGFKDGVTVLVRVSPRRA